MVQHEISRVRRLLTLHLVAIAFLTATLVAVGNGSVFLPLMVMVIGVSSLIFVDWLEWFALHHIAAYFGMVIGTVVALAEYFPQAGNDSNQQLASIASLLIYPELVIMLQRKNRRLFEQMAIFLLLEIIVAALINENVLFGLLLAPIVLLWVAALLLFTRYTSLIQLAPDLDKPTPRVFELIVEAFRKARERNRPQPSKMLDVVQPQQTRGPMAASMTLAGQAIPLGIVCIFCSGLYFYILPRTTVDLTPLGMAPRTGLAESMTLGSMGRLLQDKTPVMRVSLRDAETGRPYRLVEPPYIRSMVLSRYTRGSSAASMTSFEGQEQSSSTVSDTFEPLGSLRPYGLDASGDEVLVHFDILSADGSMLPCIAPMSLATQQRNDLSLLPFEWRLINNRSDQAPQRMKGGYVLLTTGFQNGGERPVLPDSRSIFNRPSRNVHAALLSPLSQARIDRNGSYYSTDWIADLLKKVEQFAPGAKTSIQKAKAVEGYLAHSGQYTYSLASRTAGHHDIDPIEDFVVNQKRGHCQYFAAALVMALRYQHIPSRIVMGYHPLEYNELGQYFSVRRSDAHAWVEAYFDSESLKAEGLYTSDCGDRGGWLRLDPTPAGIGSNAGNTLRPQSGQGIDIVNKFWSDYVLNGRQRAEDNSLYEPLEESTLATWQSLSKTVQALMEQLRENAMFGGIFARKEWFAWQVAILIAVLGTVLVMLWRLVRWLPRWAPQLAKKLGLGQSGDDIHQQFFKQALRMLHRAGFIKRSGQTAAEYTSAAGETLVERKRWSSAPECLAMLTSAYYSVRFGGNKSLPHETQQEIVRAINEMERKL